jgi:hypothetical protein
VNLLFSMMGRCLSVSAVHTDHPNQMLNYEFRYQALVELLMCCRETGGFGHPFLEYLALTEMKSSHPPDPGLYAY